MVCRLQTEDNSSNHHYLLASFPDPAQLQATKSWMRSGSKAITSTNCLTCWLSHCPMVYTHLMLFTLLAFSSSFCAFSSSEAATSSASICESFSLAASFFS